MFNTISFVSPFSLPFLSSFSLFFFPFKLSQCEICLWCCFFFRIRRLWRWVLITLIVFPFPSSFYASFLPFFLLWRSPLYPYPPLALLLRLPNPFFNLLCALFQSLPRNQRNKRRRLLPKRPILVSPLSLFFYFFIFFIFTGVDTGVRDSELAIPEGLWDPFRLLAFKLPRGLKVPWHLQGMIHQWGRLQEWLL